MLPDYFATKIRKSFLEYEYLIDVSKVVLKSSNISLHNSTLLATLFVLSYAIHRFIGTYRIQKREKICQKNDGIEML